MDAGRGERELEDVLARIRAGVWVPPVKADDNKRLSEQTFHEYATACLEGRKGELSENTYSD